VDTLNAVNIDLRHTTLHNFPHAFISKRAEPILIRPLAKSRHENLLDMYLAYQPRNSFSGLPPITDQACTTWVKGMIETAVNLVALSFGDGVIGHGALFPIDEQSCEFLLVISPKYQRIGIGTELTRCAVQIAGELDFEKILLNVEARNHIARHVYEKCGFHQDSHSMAEEVDMSLDIRQHHHATEAIVRDVMNTHVITVHPGMSCKIPLMIFLADRVAALPVTDRTGRVTGILSMSDLLDEANILKRVREVETRQVVTIRDAEPVTKAISLFRSRKVRCIPVLDGRGKLVGVVERKDILAHYLARHRVQSESSSPVVATHRDGQAGA